MAFEQRSLDDYIDVAQRIADFREKYPEGTLAPADPARPWQLVQAQGFDKNGEITQQTFLVYVAAAYRDRDDPRPGIGSAWEIFPGRSNFTRGSELQNAETSAWGRAIIAVGASDSKRGIASREEVRNRQAEREEPPCSYCQRPKHELPTATCAVSWNKDGSLSRSRTSDAQKQEAGVMTDAEQRAHNKLVKETLPAEPGRVERLQIDPEWADRVNQADPWTVQERPKPAGWLLSEAFAKLGVFDRKERLEQCSEIVGRPVASSKELDPMEVGAVLEWLQRKSELPEVAPDAH
jgi:hypothetical protein